MTKTEILKQNERNGYRSMTTENIYYKYVWISTNQLNTKSSPSPNPNPKPTTMHHAIVNIQSNFQ